VASWRSMASALALALSTDDLGGLSRWLDAGGG
jgi:hypothetical protein